MQEVTGCTLLITSGNRTPEYNKKIGGAKFSYHLKKNSARDIIPKDKNCISIKALGKIACEYTSTIVYKRHIHIDNRKKRLCINARYKN